MTLKSSFCLIFLMLFAQAAFAGFEKVKIPGFDKTSQEVWVHHKNKKLVITANVLKDAWFELTPAGSPDYVRKLEETRGTVNFFAGITEWSVKKHSFIQNKERGELSLQGEFIHSKKPMHFRELQIFLKPNIYQIKISSPDVTDLSEEKTSVLFEAVKKELP